MTITANVKVGHRMLKEEVKNHQILSLITGSHAYGLNVEGSDKDVKTIVVEPLRDVAGLSEPWGGKVYSQDGEQDYEVYGLRKFLRLALKGNPTVTELLFNQLYVDDPPAVGLELQDLYPFIVSRQAGKAYLGYMEAQRKRLTGERGNAGHGIMRTELIEQHGFDTKFAMHMLRLGFQGIELLSEGHLTLPIREPNRTYLRQVREGAFSIDQCLSKAAELEVVLKDLLKTSSVQDQPQTEAVEEWMLAVYFEAWANQLLSDSPDGRAWVAEDPTGYSGD